MFKSSIGFLYGDRSGRPRKVHSTCTRCTAIASVEGLRRCADCHDAIYCSVQCQQDDREKHRPHCKQFLAARRAGATPDPK